MPILATAPLLLAGVVVLGGGRDDCPSADAVAERMEELRADDRSGVPETLILDGAAGALRVRLVGMDGVVREEKTLELRGSCPELAEAVAILVVAWRSRLQSDEVPPPVLPVLRPAEPPAPPPAPPPAAPPDEPPDLEVSVGVQTSSGVERWAPWLLLGAQAPVWRRLNLGVTLDLSGPRVAFDPGLTRWIWVQLRAVAGPSLRAVTEDLFVDGQLGLGAGLDVALNDATPGSRYHRASPAVVGGTRLTYRRTPSLPWFGVTLTVHLDPALDSPVLNTNIRTERWLLGLALGGTLAFEGERRR